MLKLVFYVPSDHVEEVKNAVFEAGAGKYGNYSHCAWQTSGTGQFKPLKDSNPHIGKINELARVEEYRVEVICEENLINHVIEALKRVHPYEAPAYDVLLLMPYSSIVG